MGLAALRKVLVTTPLDPATLRGQLLAVDADNLVWAFATAMGPAEPPKGPDGRSIAHLIGLTSRLKLYAQWGVRSCWIFDGEQPALKADTLAEREERADAMAAVWVGEKELQEAKDVLLALGVPWVVAKGESDAHAAFLVREGVAHCAVTQDYDAILHACPRTARNLGASKTRTPEMLELASSLGKLGVTHAQLVDAAILIGTDYNPGIKGVGPVKALGLVKKHGDVHSALAAIGQTMPHVDEIRALFHDHAVDRAWRPTFRKPDAARVNDVFARSGLSEKRAGELTEAMGRIE